MELKRVSFKVAKAIKDAGYPQGNISPCYVTENCTKQYNTEIITKEIRLRIKRYKEGDYIEKLGFADERCEPPICYAPTYMEVWLWLGREKSIIMEPEYCEDGWMVLMYGVQGFYKDPEEAIIAAIDYLVDNDLIK